MDDKVDNMAFCPSCSNWYHQKCERIPDIVFKDENTFSVPTVPEIVQLIYSFIKDQVIHIIFCSIARSFTLFTSNC